MALTSLSDPDAHAADGAVTVEVRTFIADGDPRARGLSCVVVNNSAREIGVWKNYDGARNQLLGAGSFHPIELYPANVPELQPVRVAPGLSEAIFTLSLEAILFLTPGDKRGDWRWAWARDWPAPRGAPNRSPLHGQGGLGWQVRRAESCVLFARVEVDGRPVDSQRHEIRVPKLPIETVRVLARFTTGRVEDTATERNYTLNFRVEETYEGSLAEHEQTFTLPSHQAETLMRYAGVRAAKGPRKYFFTGPPRLLTFARIAPQGKTPGLLLLTDYERRAASGKP